MMKKIASLLIYLSFLITITYSQSADEIISNYIKNAGGIDKWRSLKSLKLTGILPTPQGDFNFTIYKKAPNKILTEIDIQGLKLIPQAFDGEVAWAMNPLAGDNKPQKLSEDMTKNVKEEAVFEDPFIDYKLKGNIISNEGKEMINGIECFKLKLIKSGLNEKKIQYYFFDTEYFMPVYIKYELNENKVETHLSEYNEIEGYMMPLMMIVKINGEEIQKINIKYVEINPQINDDIFKFIE